MTVTETALTTAGQPTTQHITPRVGVDLAPSISADELAHHDLARVGLVDVRSAAEFESMRIDGSHNIPLDELDVVADRLAQSDSPLVLICQSGDRAQRAQQVLQRAGHQRTSVLEGGISSWRTRGGDVIGARNRWAMDRQVRGVAGSIVLASILASLRFPRARFVAGGVGVGLTFSAVSNTCAMAKVLAKLPYNRTAPADVDTALRHLTASPAVR